MAYVSELRHETLYTGEENKFSDYVYRAAKCGRKSFESKGKDGIKKKNLQLRYKISTEEEKNNLESNLPIGLTCLAKGSLVEPEASRNENSFNYQRYLKQQNIHWILKAENITWSHCSVSEFFRRNKAKKFSTTRDCLCQ